MKKGHYAFLVKCVYPWGKTLILCKTSAGFLKWRDAKSKRFFGGLFTNTKEAVNWIRHLEVNRPEEIHYSFGRKRR